ncbi:hypothetical protein [Pantoea sp. App145]|uniref:hypothetical protein n=1 Tax=Pantoea sp. App145 TaxID=3071567 RepID=UPI003A803B5B
MKLHKYNIFGVSILLIMVLASSLIKYKNMKDDNGIENIEASYHVLLIAKSISERNFSEHHFLPLVTLGGAVNSNIPWGAAVPDKSGGYIYTSFPSFGFLVPEMFIRTLNLDYSIQSLFYINLLILISTSIISYSLILKLFKPERCFGFVLAAIACAPLILSRESLASSGILYWPQSLSQLLISAFMLSVARRIESKTRSSLFFVFASCLLIALTEWTGFVLGGLSLLYFTLSKANRDYRLAISIMSSLVASLLIFGMQLLLTLDLSTFTSASLARFSVRSGENANFTDLIFGYYESFSLFLLVIPVYIAHKFIGRNKSNNLTRIAILLCVFMLVENVILAQHATSYTFDRFKLAFLLAVLIGELIVSEAQKLRLVTLVIILISIPLSINTYKKDISKFKDWVSIQKSNHELASRIKEVNGFECARIFNSTRVRAYLNLILNRSVWEHVPGDSDLRSSTDSKCPIIIINGDLPYKDLQEISSAYVYRNGIKVETIE